MNLVSRTLSAREWAARIFAGEEVTMKKRDAKRLVAYVEDFEPFKITTTVNKNKISIKKQKQCN